MRLQLTSPRELLFKGAQAVDLFPSPFHCLYSILRYQKSSGLFVPGQMLPFLPPLPPLLVGEAITDIAVQRF